MSLVSAVPLRLGHGAMASLLGLCAVLSLVPFVVAPLPGMPDFYNHMARFFILNHGADSAFLRRYYAVNWSVIGNLGMDLLVMPFDRMLGPERGAIAATALIAPLTIAGLAALSRAVRGFVTPTLFLALPFVYSYPALYGFINYHLAVALAFLGAASWIATRSWPPSCRLGLHALLATLIWLAHVGGWLVFIVLAASHELVSTRRHGDAWGRALVRAVAGCLPLCLPLVFMAMWRSGQSHWVDGALDPRIKLEWFGVFLASEWRPLDMASAVGLEVAAVGLLWRERETADRPLLFAAACLGLLFLALPQRLFGSYFADLRLLPVAFMVLFLAFAPRSPRLETRVAIGGFGLFALRIGLMTLGWHARGANAVADLAVLDNVPDGSRIAVRARANISEPWPLSTLDELASLAIVRRQAFVNTEWDLPGGQVMRPIYNRGIGFNDCTSVYGWTEAYPSGLTVAEFLSRLPRDRFDYVWDFMDSGLSAPWLVPVGAGPDGRLYRVLHGVVGERG